MYDHSPHTQNTAHLIVAALQLHELIESNALFEAYDGDTDEAKAQRACAVLDRFGHAVTAIRAPNAQTHPSPFRTYRKQIMGLYSTGQRLASLVLHLYNSRWEPDLPSLLANADEEHVRIALELMASYARNGENDPEFMALARQILRRDHPELYQDEMEEC